jgi:hypothetical protein
LPRHCNLRGKLGTVKGLSHCEKGSKKATAQCFNRSLMFISSLSVMVDTVLDLIFNEMVELLLLRESATEDHKLIFNSSFNACSSMNVYVGGKIPIITLQQHIII